MRACRSSRIDGLSWKHHTVRLMQSKGKERVVCLTAERRTKRRGFKGSLHVCKVVSGTLQVCQAAHATEFTMLAYNANYTRFASM